MNIVQLYNKFDRFAHYIFSFRFSKRSSKHYYKLYKRNGIEIKKLTSAQKKSIRKLWGVHDYSTHILYYSITGEFNERICSELVFRTKIEPYFNDKRVNYAWDDKCFFDVFQPELPFPYTLIRNVRGMYFDHDYKAFDLDEAIKIVSQNLPVIIKPSIVSGSSRGIYKIEKVQEVEQILKHYHRDFVVQRIITPCKVFKLLSPKAVCIMRIITLIMDNKSVLLSSTLRINTSDAIADGYITKDGRGMLAIGINEDGTLKDSGIHSCGERISKLPNGIEFAGKKIPNYDMACKMVTNAHMRMPMFRIVGWDVTIDENLNPIIMEYNLKGMGIYYYQLVNGPLFGDITEKVIKEMEN